MRSFILSVAVSALTVSAAWAGAPAAPPGLISSGPVHDPWRIVWLPYSGDTAPLAALPLVFPPARFQPTADQPLHAAAVEHSHAFQTRSKIHKYASFATLPLFATEVALGQSLYNATGDTSSRRGVHAFVGASIVALFGVDTVTGAWNMFGAEGRKDTQGRTMRLVHGLLMMAADAGFVATTAAAPGNRERDGASFNSDKRTHRNLAVASISVGTAGYLLMLFGNH